MIDGVKWAGRCFTKGPENLGWSRAELLIHLWVSLSCRCEVLAATLTPLPTVSSALPHSSRTLSIITSTRRKSHANVYIITLLYFYIYALLFRQLKWSIYFYNVKENTETIRSQQILTLNNFFCKIGIYYKQISFVVITVVSKTECWLALRNQRIRLINAKTT